MYMNLYFILTKPTALTLTLLFFIFNGLVIKESLGKLEVTYLPVRFSVPHTFKVTVTVYGTCSGLRCMVPASIAFTSSGIASVFASEYVSKRVKWHNCQIRLHSFIFTGYSVLVIFHALCIVRAKRC